MAMRQSTARGQMTRGANSGPAIMLIPPAIRATFMPNPPLKHILSNKHRRKHPITGVSTHMIHFEKNPPPKRPTNPTSAFIKEEKRRLQEDKHRAELQPLIEAFRDEQRDSGGEYKGMNCYNTLFVGRLAYEVTERKLLREMESFGPVKDIRIVKDHDGKSRGYAVVEFMHEEDMKRAYRAADGMRIEGRDIVVDVERGHTVPTWLPRRLGGGLGGTRLGGGSENVNRPGRYDPSKPDAPQPPPLAATSMSHGMGRGAPPPVPSIMNDFQQGMGRGRGFRDGPPSHGAGGGGWGGGYGGPPPPPQQQQHDWDRVFAGGASSGYDDRKRRRSRTPPHDNRDSRRRY
jgi:U1 small nuclear ribonucleoprotein